MTAKIDLHAMTVLMVVAHCDDELVCGWPIFQDRSIAKSVLVVSSDRHNEGRRWCGHRKFVTIDLCQRLAIPVKVLDYDSDFYKLDSRDGSLARFEEDVIKQMSRFSYDAVFTHNPHGEYGHLDHKFLFDLISRSSNAPLLITDLTMTSSWTSSRSRSARHDALYFRAPVGEAALDENFYREAQRFYETRGVWTWSEPPSRSARLYVV